MNSLPPDFFSITLSTCFYLAINFIWYSSWLFGTKNKSPIKEIVSLALLGFVISYFLYFFERYLQVTIVSDGMLVSLSAWIGFILTNEAISLLRKRKTVRHFFIDSGASLLSYLVMGGLLGG